MGKLTKNNIGPKIVLYLYSPGSCLLYPEVLAHHIVEVVKKERWRAQNLKLENNSNSKSNLGAKLEELNFEPKIKLSVRLKKL